MLLQKILMNQSLLQLKVLVILNVMKSKHSLTIIVTTLLISCSQSISSSTLDNSIFVSFNEMGGSPVAPLHLEAPGVILEPLPPTKDAFFFLHWYVEDPLIPWDFSTVITTSLTLIAAWESLITTPAILSLAIDIPIESVTRETYQVGALTIANTQSPWRYDDLEMEIRGRGNGGSWGYEQKGYRLKLKQALPLFGEVQSKHWVLVPGGHDFGLIRNHAAFTLGKHVFNGIPYTTSSRYIELYVNQTYHGLYHLFEHVRVDQGRIEIDASYGLNETGYLLELDSYATGIEGIDYFWTHGIRYPFTVKSPEPDEWEGIVTESTYRNQIQFVQNKLQLGINAIYQKNQTLISEIFDLASMVDMYLLHELFKNTDTGWSSFYLYQVPGGRFYFAPPWDFDFTAGISRGDASVEDLYVGDRIREYSDFTSSELYLALMQQSWFVNLAKTRYLGITNAIAEQLIPLSLIQTNYLEAFTRHAIRWPWYQNWRGDQIFVQTWLQARNAWLAGWANR